MTLINPLPKLPPIGNSKCYLPHKLKSSLKTCTGLNNCKFTVTLSPPRFSSTASVVVSHKVDLQFQVINQSMYDNLEVRQEKKLP